jgi:hypothetical protein
MSRSHKKPGCRLDRSGCCRSTLSALASTAFGFRQHTLKALEAKHYMSGDTQPVPRVTKVIHATPFML